MNAHADRRGHNAAKAPGEVGFQAAEHAESAAATLDQQGLGTLRHPLQPMTLPAFPAWVTCQ
jgi:hypothetical protein